MIVAFDADILCLLLYPSITPPIDPGTGKPVEHARARLQHLVTELETSRARIVVPAPALAEFLVVAGDRGPDYIRVIDRQAVFRIEPFDTAAAIEAAASTRMARSRGDKKSGATGPWQCVKVDRQIVAVAKLRGVTEIYSNDSDMRKMASGLKVVSVWELPVPQDEPTLPFDDEPGRPSEEQQ